jgi:hypothetical protein
MNNSIRLTIITLLLVISSLSAATHYVSLESTNPTPPYTNWATAATTIQQAVDAAVAGSEILVTNGVYPGGLAVTNPLTLLSVNGPQFTVINGGGTNRCAFLADGARLSGFTLTNGSTGDFAGGGVWCASTNALLTNCTLTGNSATYYGGGAAGGTLNNCTIIGNAAKNGGGGFYCTLYRCVLTDNVAHGDAGGAYYCTLQNCTLTGNSAIWEGFMQGAEGGGAKFCMLYRCVLTSNVASGAGMGASYCTLFNCALSRNSSASIWISEAAFNCTLYNCTLTSNLGDGAGGSTLYNCVLTGNSRFGAFGGTLYNCTLTGNGSDYGGGAYGCSLNNCIVYLNTAGDNANYDASCTLNYCCTTPLPTNGVGNITDAPLFVDYTIGNLRLQPDSPCINAGNNEYATNSIIDLDGNPRISGSIVDIGAYEFVFTPTMEVAQLILLVNDSDLRVKDKQPLLATLSATMASFERGKLQSGANQLHAFQNKVRAQVARMDAALANELINAAQQIIEEVTNH